MMIKVTDGDSFETNRSLIQELTFNSLKEEMTKRNLEFTEVQMKNLGILTADNIYSNMGLLVSESFRELTSWYLKIEKNLQVQRFDVENALVQLMQ